MIEVFITRPGMPEHARFDAVVEQLYPPDSPRWRGGHEPDAKHLDRCLVLLREDRPMARCALYINPHLHTSGERIGLVGSYECSEVPELSQWLWQEVEQWARMNGLDRLIGPMDGSTWNSHRFNDDNAQRAFFLEPWHHAQYPAQWRAAGFGPLAHYRSNVRRGIGSDDHAWDGQEATMHAHGLRIRALDPARMEEELVRIGHFSIEAFAGNFLYSPITAGEFVAKYAPVQRFIDPELVLLMEDTKGGLVALLFAIKDHFDPEGHTLIIKSLARRKDAPVKGLGAWLVMKLERIALQRECTAIIHAFMHEDNFSLVMSDGRLSAEPWRSYTLFSKRVAP